MILNPPFNSDLKWAIEIRPLIELGLLKMSSMSFCKFRWPNAVESLAVSISFFTPVNISVFGAE